MASAATPLCDALVKEGTRLAIGCKELNKGGEATIYCVDDPSPEKVAALTGLAPDMADLDLTKVIIKKQKWIKTSAFQAEARITRRAAALGIAPDLHYSEVEPKSTGVVQGCIVMERLTGPNYFRWLHWISKDVQRERGERHQSWGVTPDAMSTGVQRMWAAEAVRVRDVMLRNGIEQGDWHERNLMFHVPSLMDMATDPKTDPKDLKHNLMQAIAEGPSAKKAFLWIIDFGQARELRMPVWLRMCCAPMLISRRIADPSEEGASPETRGHKVIEQQQVRRTWILRSMSKAVFNTQDLQSTPEGHKV